MAKYRTLVTATGNTYLCDINKPRGADQWSGTIIAYETVGGGTFGGTTLTLGLSSNGGTTVIPLDTTIFSTTGNATVTFPVAGSANENGEDLKLYAIATGGTGINITVDVLDNV
jgi:hypothetical protein